MIKEVWTEVNRHNGGRPRVHLGGPALQKPSSQRTGEWLFSIPCKCRTVHLSISVLHAAPLYNFSTIVSFLYRQFLQPRRTQSARPYKIETWDDILATLTTTGKMRSQVQSAGPRKDVSTIAKSWLSKTYRTTLKR